MTTENPHDLNCWSETGELKSIIICKPTSFNVSQEDDLEKIGFKDAVSAENLLGCYSDIENILHKRSIKTYNILDFIPEKASKEFDNCINRIFVRDIAGVVGNTIVLGKAALKSRSTEFKITHDTIHSIFSSPKENINYLIEFGDLIILNNKTIIINFGLRTEKKAVFQLLNLVQKQGFERLIVVNFPPSYQAIHLDLMFNILKENNMYW